MTSVLAIQRFADLLRLRAGPQDVPASNVLLLVAIVALGLVNTLVIQRVYTLELAVLRTGVDLLLQFAFVASVLNATRHPERIRQTFTALCGVGAVITLLVWPLIDVVLDRPAGDDLAVMATVLVLGIYGWGVAVLGHIFRHALDRTLGQGVLVALVYVLLLSLAADALVPPTETP